MRVRLESNNEITVRLERKGRQVNTEGSAGFPVYFHKCFMKMEMRSTHLFDKRVFW